MSDYAFQTDLGLSCCAAALRLVVADILTNVLAEEAALGNIIRTTHSPTLDIFLVVACQPNLFT